MAKRKKSRKGKGKGGRLTKAEIRKAGSLKAAWRARKSGKRAKVKSPRKRARRASAKRAAVKRKRKSATRRSKARKAYAKAGRRKTRKSGKRRSHRSKSGSRSASRSRSNTSKTHTRIEKQLVVRHVPAGGLRVVGAAPKRRKAKRRGAKRRKGGRSRKRSRKGQFKRGGGRIKGAMENPMGGGELFVGFLFGAVGFMVGDAIDRGLATHALTDTGKKNTAGQEIFGDPQAADGPYKGLYNATAICAPMSATRWVVGILGAAVPITVAHFVSAPLGRAGLQFFGFAYGVRIVGKGLIDLMAIMTRNTEVGQRLYDGEMRSMVLKGSGGNLSDPNLAFLPQSGLGRPKHIGAGNCACDDCSKKNNGVGYPSQPRIVDTNAGSGPPPPPPGGGGGNATPTPTTGQTTPGTSSVTERSVQLTGVPRGMAAPPPPKARINPFNWGYQE